MEKEDRASTENSKVKVEDHDSESNFLPNSDGHLLPICPKEEGSDDFNFESESYALQNNKDYLVLVKTLVKLEAQKIQAIKGLERLHEAREAILKDPFACVKALQNGENLNLPGPIDVAEVPDIEWSKYDIYPIVQGFRPKTRRHAKESMVPESVDNAEGDSNMDTKTSGKSEKGKNDTFNVQWTLEEQRRLEELLIKYPDEPMSSKRWAKIAKELGTRSLMQVQSRVQKYFIALKKEGLPVPGRNPKRHIGRCLKRRTASSFTQFTSKFMRAFDLEPGTHSAGTEKRDVAIKVEPLQTRGIDASDEEDILEELRDTQEYQELLRLKRARKLKLEEMQSGDVVHHGFSCNGCGSAPICGPRWHCNNCPQNPGVDFCERCALHFQNEVHLQTHTMNPVKALSLKDTIKC